MDRKEDASGQSFLYKFCDFVRNNHLCIELFFHFLQKFGFAVLRDSCITARKSEKVEGKRKGKGKMQK